MATFQERLDDCFSKGTTKAQGDAFELLVQDYYQNDPKWDHIDEVWLWQEWPKHQQYGREMGVDLVLQDRNGGLIAVQAKGYGDQTPVSLEDVLKFDNFAKNNLHIYTKHLVTSGSISGPAQEVIEREHIIVIDRKQLESADIEWAETSGTKKGREEEKTRIQEAKRLLNAQKKKEKRDAARRAVKRKELWEAGRKEAFAMGRRDLMYDALGTLEVLATKKHNQTRKPFYYPSRDIGPLKTMGIGIVTFIATVGLVMLFVFLLDLFVSVPNNSAVGYAIEAIGIVVAMYYMGIHNIFKNHSTKKQWRTERKLFLTLTSPIETILMSSVDNATARKQLEDLFNEQLPEYQSMEASLKYGSKPRRFRYDEYSSIKPEDDSWLFNTPTYYADIIDIPE